MSKNRFETRLASGAGGGLRAAGISTVQANVTLRCNQQCRHCHLACSPQRTEEMDWPTMQLVLDVARRSGCSLVDLTGGAPELHEQFTRFVLALRQGGYAVQVRTNLTVLLEPGLETMGEFLADNEVRLVASMPCYLEENVDAQRGRGAYRRSIAAIKLLNDVGYGRPGELQLNLVFNPAGPVLPPSQLQLEADYRRELRQRFGIEFSNLLTITNMPIGRFGEILQRDNRREEYMALLSESFNARTVPDLMCRHQVSIGFDGTLYDCDFNLALGFPVDHGAPDHLRNFDAELLADRRIVTGEHCFGCTAGAGSSCGGALL